VTLLFVVVGIAIVAGVSVLIARDRPLLAEDPVDARALRWPPDGPVGPGDLAAARFTVVLRGYRMDEVDRVLDDARAALAERDRVIAELRADRAAPGEPPAPGAARGAPGGVPVDATGDAADGVPGAAAGGVPGAARGAPGGVPADTSGVGPVDAASFGTPVETSDTAPGTAPAPANGGGA
jgi:DivIVA domain-containing protein